MGEIAEIWRHPIKSHGREKIARVDLQAGATMPWDRVWAVAHTNAKTDGTKWAPCANFARGSQRPGLMGAYAKVDEISGRVTLTHKDMSELDVNPDTEGQKLIDWSNALAPNDLPKAAKIIKVPGRGSTDTDFSSVSIGNLATHRSIEQKLGHKISHLRWRINFWIEGLPAWEEFELVGKTLKIGSAEISIRERIERCKATMANPDTGVRDVDTLSVLRVWGHQDMGVYGYVSKGGTISTADIVEVF